MGTQYNTKSQKFGGCSKDQSIGEQYLSKVALLGDSPLALSISFLFLLVAIYISFWTKDAINYEHDPYERLGPVPVIDPPVIFSWNGPFSEKQFLSPEMHQAFQRDGVIAIRGLLPQNLVEQIDQDSQKLVQEQNSKTSGRKRRGTQFHTVVHGAIFRNETASFRTLSLQSNIPIIAAELLNLTETQTLRLLRDIFLAKDDDPYVCGWHVDDLGFWPATPSSPGVNAWVALDDMASIGGAFALAVGSHTAPWKEEAHFITGASTLFPPGGYLSAADMFAKRTGAGTCNLQHSAPHLHRRMEETKRVYPVQKGDVIFHTRWLFHRTVAMENSNQQHDGQVYRRYSLRYGPGSSTIPPGYGTEPSVLWDDENGGRTADDVSRLDGPWYPKAWPTADPIELDAIPLLVKEKMPRAYERQAERKREMKPFLKQLGEQKHQTTEKLL